MNLCGFPDLNEVTARLCHDGGDVESPRRIVVWGDSHAAAWAPAWSVFGREHGVHTVLIAVSSCPPILGVRSGNDPVTLPFECLKPGYGDAVRDGVWMYRDDDHISFAAALLLRPVVTAGL